MHGTLHDRPELLGAGRSAPIRRLPVGGATRGVGGPGRRGETGHPVVDAAAAAALGERLCAQPRAHDRGELPRQAPAARTGCGGALREVLTNGDWAQNNAGWQWSAGCGADAQPYFRVFNPILQGENLGPEGDYVRRWVPELASVPAKHIHRPGEALDEAAGGAGASFSAWNGPRGSIVEHAWARELIWLWRAPTSAEGVVRRAGLATLHGDRMSGRALRGRHDGGDRGDLPGPRPCMAGRGSGDLPLRCARLLCRWVVFGPARRLFADAAQRRCDRHPCPRNRSAGSTVRTRSAMISVLVCA